MRKYPLSLLKDKNIVTFFDFWGKTRRGEKDGGDDYHLLCWHSLDVAAMGYLMVKSNCFGLADYFRQLGFADTELAAQFSPGCCAGTILENLPALFSNFTCTHNSRFRKAQERITKRSLIQRWATGCGTII